MDLVNFKDISLAHARIFKFIKNTPIYTNDTINKILGANIFFKMDNHQETRSFKVRGAFNAILSYLDKHHHLPKKIVAQSSGNHAQALAFAGKKFGIEVLIYMAENTSPLKVKTAREYGATVILCKRRIEANQLAEKKQEEGYVFIHPSDNNDVIAGQGTCALEAFMAVKNIKALFAPCGGGGLLSGSLISKNALSPTTKVIGCEPLNANDAKRSIVNNKIEGYEDSPNTIADGARTLKVSNRCFQYLQQLDDIIEISEEKIIYWQQYLSKLFQENIEPTSALSIAGCEAYINNLQSKSPNDNYLILITGGNIDDQF
jgi:threonine dehydratase